MQSSLNFKLKIKLLTNLTLNNRMAYKEETMSRFPITDNPHNPDVRSFGTAIVRSRLSGEGPVFLWFGIKDCPSGWSQSPPNDPYSRIKFEMKTWEWVEGGRYRITGCIWCDKEGSVKVDAQGEFNLPGNKLRRGHDFGHIDTNLAQQPHT